MRSRVAGTNHAGERGKDGRIRLRLNRSLLILGALVCALFLVGCGGGSQTMNGILELYGEDGSIATDGTTCSGTGGYGDIQEGADVTIRDESGELIGSGSLDKGSSEGSGSSITCTFLWEVPDVPESDFYEIEVSSRGALTYSKEQLEANNWIVSGTIGN